MDDCDRLAGQLGVRIELLECSVVPALHLTEKDTGKRWAVDHDLARADPRKVEDGDDAAHDHGELDEATLVKLSARQRGVGRTEHHGLGLDLLYPPTGPDRLVIQSDPGILLISIGPFSVDRIGKGRAGTRNVGGRGSHGRRDERASYRQGSQWDKIEFHGFSPSV